MAPPLIVSTTGDMSRAPSAALATSNAVSALRPPGSTLFVYGTLLSGYTPAGNEAMEPPDTLRTAKRLGAATLPGFEMRDLGRYPCIVPAAELTRSVVGEVYEIADETQWTELDKYEGISSEDDKPFEYCREAVSVIIAGSTKTVVAQTYVYNPILSADRLPLIAHGDFLAHYVSTNQKTGRKHDSTQ